MLCTVRVATPFAAAAVIDQTPPCSRPAALFWHVLLTPSIATCTAAVLDQTPPCRRPAASLWHVLACLIPLTAPCTAAVLDQALERSFLSGFRFFVCFRPPFACQVLHRDLRERQGHRGLRRLRGLRGHRVPGGGRDVGQAFRFSHVSHAPLSARFYMEIFVNVKDIVDFVDFVYQAGAGTWGIPAASPLWRGG